MSRPITRKGLIKKLDTLMRDLVFARDGKCVTCPIWKEMKPDFEGSWVMQPGHFITRGAKSVRWDVRNVYKQCRTCNFLHEHHPEVLSKHVISFLGKKEFNKLVFDGNQPRKFLKPELEELAEQLENFLKHGELPITEPVVKI